MGIKINTNLEALNSQRRLGVNSANLDKSLKRLASGLRINSAKDDPAGAAIVEKLMAQTRALSQSQDNSLAGVNLLQTADGALGSASAVLGRIRELAVQGANDTLTTSDRNNISTEINQLSAEIDRIADSTQFNTQNLLGGGAAATTGFNFQVGANAGQVVNVKIDTADAAALGVQPSQLPVDTAGNASQTIANVDAAISKISTIRSNLGASLNRLEKTVSTLSIQHENLLASGSRIRDLDFAKESSIRAKNSILQQSNLAILTQANLKPRSVLDLLR